VSVCRDPAFGGSPFGPFVHTWILTDSNEFGMGGDGRFPGNGGIIIPHKDRHKEPNASCEVIPDVDEGCVDAWAQGNLWEPYGYWLPPINYCATLARQVINDCRVPTN